MSETEVRPEVLSDLLIQQHWAAHSAARIHESWWGIGKPNPTVQVCLRNTETQQFSRSCQGQSPAAVPDVSLPKCGVAIQTRIAWLSVRNDKRCLNSWNITLFGPDQRQHLLREIVGNKWHPAATGISSRLHSSHLLQEHSLHSLPTLSATHYLAHQLQLGISSWINSSATPSAFTCSNKKCVMISLSFPYDS